MRKALVAAAILATVSSAAFAQMNSNSPSKNSPADQTNVRQPVLSNLEQAGFTNVKVTPNSFLVQARDKSGNPVTMFIGPNSFTKVTTIGTNAQSSATNAIGAPGDAFTTVPAKDSLSSKVVGLEVYNNAKQGIGTIKDIAFNDNGIDGYILSVGGFLGIGDHYVAVRPAAVNLTYDRGNNRWHASMDASADQLKAAPEFEYSNNS